MNLDIIPNGAIKRVHVSQNDVGRTLTFELFNNSTSYTVPSGATVKIQGTKPSGFGFSETCTVNGNVATIDTTEAMTDESGNIQTELSISYGDVVIGTSNFVLAVEKNPHPDTTTDGSMETIIPQLTLLVNEVKEYAEEIEGTYHAYGSPWVASTVAEMTDTDKIYVYTGSESGYTNGNWYYYNGSSWVSGGIYNSVAVQTDTTLSISGMPADAKAVGDIKNAMSQLPYTTTPGYRASSGELVSPSDPQAEVTTSLIYVKGLGKINVVLSFTSNHALWACYCKYDQTGNFLGRVTFGGSASASMVNQTIELDSTVYYVDFSFRTYSDCTPYITYSGVQNVLYDVRNRTVDLEADVESNNFENINGFTNSAIWEQGSVTNSGGDYPNSERIRTASYIEIHEGEKVRFKANGQAYLYYLINSSGTLVYKPSWYFTTDQVIYVPTDMRLRIMVANQSVSGAITPSDRLFDFEIIRRENLYDDLLSKPYEVTSWEQGAIDSSGADISATTRIRTKPIPFSKETIFNVYPNGQQILYHLYDADFQHLSTSSWNISKPFQFQQASGGFIRFVVGTQSLEGDISVSDRLANVVYGSIASYFGEIGDDIYDTSKQSYSYQGEKLLFGEHKYQAEYTTLAQTNQYIQGLAIYDDKAFMSYDVNHMLVFDITNGTKIADFEIGGLSATNHANSMVFAPTLHYGNTEYPYLYMSEHHGNGNLYVINVYTYGGNYSADVVQTIDITNVSTGTTGAGYNDFAIDFDNEKLYMGRYKTSGTYQQTDGNYLIFTEFDLPNVVEGTTQLTDANIISNWSTNELIYARQQLYYYDGKLYQLSGGGGFKKQQQIRVYDVGSKGLQTFIEIGEAVDWKEPEGIYVYNGQLYIDCANTDKLYKLMF